MIITVFSLKGGVGKTSLSLNIALELDYHIIENDLFGGVVDILNHIKGDIHGITVKDEDEKIPLVKNTVYDFGGFRDKRIYPVIEKSDLVIVPTLHSYADIKSTVATILRVKKINPDARIAVAINRVNTAAKVKHDEKIYYRDYIDTKSNILHLLKETEDTNKVYFLNIRENLSWKKSTSEGLSITQMAENQLIMKYHARAALEDLNKILKVIITLEGNKAWTQEKDPGKLEKIKRIMNGKN